jgi:DNA mismatch endonuclease (patch repair protein)
MMSGIRATNTRPEMLLRKGLHALGWRYRIHGRAIPGKPDLVFPGKRALIFANGCFWHGHDCHLFKWPKSRPEFWREKIGSNIERDQRVREQLLAQGWRIAEVWECTLKGRERLSLEHVLAACEAFLHGHEQSCSVGSDQRISVPASQCSANC